VFSISNAAQGAEHGAQERFQSFMTMMDSMTDKELDHPDIQKLLSDNQQVRKTHGHDGSKFPPWAAKGAPSIGRSRIKRIAVGCGQAEPMVSDCDGWTRSGIGTVGVFNCPK
jgi:signal recognition particle GTPase